MSTESDLSHVFSAEAAIEKDFLKPQSSFSALRRISVFDSTPYTVLPRSSNCLRKYLFPNRYRQ